MARKKSAAKKAREEAEKAAFIQKEKELEKGSDDLGDDIDIEKEEDEGSSSSSDEDEDEVGELLTADIDKGINEVLETIRKNPKELLNKDKKFFGEIPQPGERYHKKDDKMTLQDYQRKRLLETNGNLEDEDEDDSGEKPYAVQQQIDQDNIMDEIKDIVGEDEEDDDFLEKKKDQPVIESVQLPDSKNEEEFLKAFIDNKAWVPTKSSTKQTPQNDGEEDEDDDDGEEFDKLTNQYEYGYNFRYEEEDANEIISYARNQATMRREKQSSRKRARDRKKEAKKQEEEAYKSQVNKVKKQKTKEVLDKLEQLKQEAGEDIGLMFNEDDLEGDFDASEWDKRMSQMFNDDFYAQEEKKQPKYDDDEEVDGGEVEAEAEAEVDNDEPVEEMSKNQQKKKEKQKQREEKQQLRAKAAEFVEKNLDLALEEANVKEPSMGKFRYREVSPDSFGLSARDILFASDKQLNNFVGLKKLGEYRDPELKKKDRRKYAKKRRVEDWRKETFNNAEGPDDEMVKNALAGEQPSKKRKKKHA